MKNYRILYLSCHEILEYDDLRMFTQAGHQVFSVGSFSSPGKSENLFRKAQSDFYHPELFDKFIVDGGHIDLRRIPQGFSQNFDVIIVNHYSEWVINNLTAFGDKPIVLRTIGQSNLHVEDEYRSLGDRISVVRYSGTERDRPGFAKTDAVVYFSKFKQDYEAWQGGDAGVTFQNEFLTRAGWATPDINEWRSIHKATGSRLFGRRNEGIDEAAGLAPAEQLRGIMQRAAFFLYVYTRPPSYHLSVIEALMAGVPVLAPSARMIARKGGFTLSSSDAPYDAWTADRYEVPRFLDGMAGLTYDTVEEGIEMARVVQASPAFAAGLSARGRERAVATFDAEAIAAQWASLFALIC